MVDEEQVVLRGLMSEEQAEQFKKNKEYKGMVLEIRPDDCDYFGPRYMLVRVGGVSAQSKHYPDQGWSEGMPFGFEVTEFFKGSIWDYCQWDSWEDKKILIYFKEGKPYVRYIKDTKQFEMI